MTLREGHDEALLKSYLDDALSAAERDETAAHLATCEDCRKNLGELHTLAREVNDTLEMHIDVPDARIALARLQVAQRASRVEATPRAASTPVESVPMVVTREATSAVQPRTHGGRLKFVMAGVGVALAIVVGLGLTMLFAPSSPRNLGVADPDDRELFLPAGTVRHMIYIGTYTVENPTQKRTPQTTEQHREEFWLTPGKKHPLMVDYVTVPMTAWNWIDNDASYYYEPDKGNTVTKEPYIGQDLATLLPDPEIITKTLQSPDAHAVDGTLDGRAVTVITYTGTGASTPTTNEGTMWVDKQTKQLLQVRNVSTTVGGPNDGLVETYFNKIEVNELRDRSDFPDDFFTFKLPPGTVLVDNMPGTPTPTQP